jgi:hypothetical protein
MGNAVEDERFPDHVLAPPEPRFPESVRDDRHIGSLFFLWEKSPPENGTQPKHVEIIRRRLENRDLEGVAYARHRRGHGVLSRESGENRLAFLVEEEARGRHREVIRPVFGPRVEMEDAVRFLEGKALEEQIVDQTKDRRVQADPEH